MKLQQMLSVITINLNNKFGLIKTIESVRNQTYRNFQFIIIDGGSNDGSIDIIKKFDKHINYWISEPDNGIYNAMNKGIVKSEGKYCIFMNSGDLFADNEVIEYFSNSGLQEDIISGNTFTVRNTNQEIIKAPKNSELTFEFFFPGGTIMHQSTFIKKKLFDEIGLYDENFMIISDWVFFLKTLIIQKCSYKNIDRNISFYNFNGISNQNSYFDVQNKERKKFLIDLLGPIFFYAYEKILQDKALLLDQEKEYKEYMSLKNGDFRNIIKSILVAKEIKKKIINLLKTI